ncbi:hypothetical protein PIB30_060404 [Stylosanthes scabra]|uniref:Cytochrome P450 n=1 Tax=Stylosanthes scabra TaxID=79078 RepID=A0ABU6QLI8_9FABA|nr:hypothetical protein [Stylosanthes scabra]
MRAATYNMVSTFILILCLTIPLILFFFFFQKQKTLKNKALLPAPRGLPIIGNLHQLDNSSLSSQLFKLSKTYGPIFSLQLGLRSAIVISSPKLAEEALKNHDRVFAGRPNLIGPQKLSYNGIAFGRRYEDEGVERSKFHDLLNECQAMLAGFFVSDYIPFMGWIDRLNGMHARLDRIFKELDKFYQEVIDEHMDPNRDTSNGEDIIDVLLQLKKHKSLSFDLTMDHIKALLLDILVAGTDTTAATTVWAMTALIKNPRVMRKVQEELRNFGGQKDFLEEEEIKKCIYFKAVIKETLRLYPPVPLFVPKETNEKCSINGYEIPSKTIVYVNAWTIHRDPKAWKDPHEFCPERFLDRDIDFLGQDFELIPFGAGRRICPGMHMALASLDLILANLLYSFDWKPPEGMTKEDIDTQVLPGVTQHKKNPLYLIAKNYKG